MTSRPRQERLDSKTDSNAPTTPATTVSDPAHAESRWFCEIFGQVVGPLTVETMREMLDQGELTPSDRIRPEFDEHWITAGELRPNEAAKVADSVTVTVASEQMNVSDLLSENQIAEEVLFSPEPTCPEPNPDRFLTQLAGELEADIEPSESPALSNTDSQMTEITSISPTQYRVSSAGHVPPQPSRIPSAGRMPPRAAHAGKTFKVPLPVVVATCVILMLFLYWTSHRSSPNVGQVHGKVTYRQQQIASAVITFSDSAQGVGASANLNRDGNYEFVNQQGGLPFGTYEVTVTPRLSDVPVGTSTAPRLQPATDIPSQYHDPRTSGLKAVVVAGKNRFDFDLSD